MKNAKLMAACLFVFLAGAAWSETLEGETETWMSASFEWGNFFDNTKDAGDTFNDYTGSPGISFSFYQFAKQRNLDTQKNTNFNFFERVSLLFPAVYSSKTNGEKTDDGRGDFDFMTQIGLMIGPAFRFDLNKTMGFYFGPGIELLFTSIEITSRDKLAAFLDMPPVQGGGFKKGSAVSLKLGVGVDLGFKFNFTLGSWPKSSLFLTAGTVLNWYFLNTARYEGEFQLAGNTYIFGVDQNKTIKDYYGFGVRPYIGIGVNLRGTYRTEFNYGTAP
jgi:hypothetical protein